VAETIKADAPRPSRRRARLLLAASFITFTVSGACMQSYTVFLVAFIEEFRWSRAETSLAYSVSQFVTGMTSPLVGVLVDRLVAHSLVQATTSEETSTMHYSLFWPVRQYGLERLRDAGHTVVTCAVLMPKPMPDFSVEQILAVHVRMHQAEGVMFPRALVQAAAACGLKVHEIPERKLKERATSKLRQTPEALASAIARLGKSVGTPWGADQKGAALAAMIGLRDRGAG